ncbi:U3 small nucleolar ribonucleo protein complex, subunit Mpp10 [Delphinella strobiligena]|nr:U3 small nucleolar ribonucleo protein complex, subunit Mpp10 [Delphinella strobiligena]
MAIVTRAREGDLLSALTSAPHAFLQPPTALHASSLSFLKDTLDPIAATLSDAQQKRLQDSRRKRKRGEQLGEEEILRLKKVHVDGFAIDQVWEQARRVIDAARKEAEKGLETLKERYAVEEEEEEDESDIGEEGVDYEIEGVDDGAEEYHTSDDEDEEEEDGDVQDDDDGDEQEEGDEDIEMGSDAGSEDDRDDEPAEEYIPDPHGLNDGFFSIDDFNRQSEFLEQADARGDEDEPSDEEDNIDWGSNPLGSTAKSGAAEDEEMEDGEDGDGPTFGNADLNAPFSDDDDDDDAEVEEGEMDEMAGLSNTNAIKYDDFFAPPAKKASRKNKKGRPNPHNFPAAEQIPGAAKDDEAINNDMQRTMEAVHRDLFDESEAEEEDEAEELDPADPRSRRSTHERRRAEIEKEIRKLEAANVAKREWTLSGEARAADRPLNSLLEEDLDFERAGKPVPVTTAEVSEGIEELIKRRILAHDFQDIIRRRPDDLATGKDARRGRFELDDTKSKKSLAEQYEEEHLKRTDPNYVDAKDEQTQKQQKEIEGLWKDIVHKLDSLSSFHFKPGPKAAQLDIRVDAPVVRLEDARPTAGAEAAGASQLAPQEVYKAGESIDKRSDEVATRGGMPVAREEMSREERKRRRRRDKERERKGNSNAEPQKKTESMKSKGRKEVIGDLKKGNVKVIGKKGELTNVDGEAIRSGPAASAGNYKL